MWKYKGGGFLAGIPARDLTDEEVKALEIDEALLLASGLYEKDAQAESAKPKLTFKRAVVTPPEEDN